MALRAAKSAGCAVPSENIDRAVAYLKQCAVTRSGGFAYQPGGGPNNPRTGTGILALEICGEHLTPEAVAGAEYLLKHPPQWSSHYFFYEVYYCPQAMFQMGDKYFLAYYPKLVAILLDHQDSDGSWLSGDGNDRSGGRDYCTRWPSWRWRSNIAICRSISDEPRSGRRPLRETAGTRRGTEPPARGDLARGGRRGEGGRRIGDRRRPSTGTRTERRLAAGTAFAIANVADRVVAVGGDEPSRAGGAEGRRLVQVGRVEAEPPQGGAGSLAGEADLVAGIRPGPPRSRTPAAASAPRRPPRRPRRPAGSD